MHEAMNKPVDETAGQKRRHWAEPHSLISCCQQLMYQEACSLARQPPWQPLTCSALKTPSPGPSALHPWQSHRLHQPLCPFAQPAQRHPRIRSALHHSCNFCSAICACFQSHACFTGNLLRTQAATTARTCYKISVPAMYAQIVLTRVSMRVVTLARESCSTRPPPWASRAAARAALMSD